jgi:hypothetical protein
MACRSLCFGFFLFLYIATGVLLAVGAYLINSTDRGYERYGSRLSRTGRYYLGIASLYILFSCVLQLIAISCCRRLLIVFRLTVVLLIVGILLELIGLTLSIFAGTGDKPGMKKQNAIVFGSITGYLILLQIFGIVTSLTYQSTMPKNYEELPSK